MYVIRPTEIETLDVSDREIFKGGSVWQLPLTGGAGKHGKDLTVTNVQFAAGARTLLHTHTCDQVLYVTAGIGKVADADGEQIISIGDAAVIPANVPHWHGASDTGSPFSHLSIMLSDSKTTVIKDEI